jgi:xanthine dehydrogenase YagR molybdenum-binding subunit
MSERIKNVGQATSRIDGLLKVTGTATYATDYVIKNTAHAVIFKSAIAAGKILDIRNGAFSQRHFACAADGENFG